MLIQRPNVLDFEASGFGVDSYPIEVGIVLSSGQKYCSLIKPADSWQHWDEQAEQIHGLSRSQLLRHGKSIGTIASELNSFLRHKIIYSDGWVVDKPWLSRLFFDCSQQPLFQLSPLEMILKEPQMAIWAATKHQVMAELDFPRHRASTDALIIQETYARTQQLTSPSAIA